MSRKSCDILKKKKIEFPAVPTFSNAFRLKQKQQTENWAKVSALPVIEYTCSSISKYAYSEISCKHHTNTFSLSP